MEEQERQDPIEEALQGESSEASEGGKSKSDILSQAEIEALLDSLQESDDRFASPKAPGAEPLKAPRMTMGRSSLAYEVYDFRRPDKFSKEQLRTLQMLHETFARLAGSATSAYLRTPVTIDLISLEQVPYEEYLRSINHSVFTIMSLPPLSGQAVLEMEFGLVFTMIDRMLGGPGQSINRNVLTDIERPLLMQTIERLFQALKAAWEAVVIVSPSIEGMETSAQFVQIAPPNDIVVTILFEVKIGQQRSAMSLCIPYLLLKPITAKLSAQKWFASSSRRHSPASRRVMAQQLGRTEIDCSIELGRAKLNIRDFLGLKSGDIVRLDQKAEDDLTLLVSRVPKFFGKPARRGKQLVFTVNDTLQE